MRFMKAAMAICGVCAMMLAVTSIRRARMMKKNSYKRGGFMRSRHR
jgi:hypothetical protein